MSIGPEVKSDSPWAYSYLALWAAWAAFATYVGVVGGPDTRVLWWYLAGSFAVLEAIGAIARSDRKPMLTEVFGRYVPGFVLVPVLALAVWRLSHWVPGWILFPGAAWQIWHFIATYHTFQKLGGEVK